MGEQKYFVEYDEESGYWEVLTRSSGFFDPIIFSFRKKEKAEAVAKALNEVDVDE